MPRVGWHECLCLHVPVCPSRLSRSLKSAEDARAGFRPCQSASVIRTTVCPCLPSLCLFSNMTFNSVQTRQ